MTEPMRGENERRQLSLILLVEAVGGAEGEDEVIYGGMAFSRTAEI